MYVYDLFMVLTSNVKDLNKKYVKRKNINLSQNYSVKDIICKKLKKEKKSKYKISKS